MILTSAKFLIILHLSSIHAIAIVNKNTFPILFLGAGITDGLNATYTDDSFFRDRKGPIHRPTGVPKLDPGETLYFTLTIGYSSISHINGKVKLIVLCLPEMQEQIYLKLHYRF